MEQTAVEWLVDKVIEYQQKGLKISKNLDKLVIEQAKEMEKQQIINALAEHPNIDSEQYYNETFKNK